MLAGPIGACAAAMGNQQHKTRRHSHDGRMLVRPSCTCADSTAVRDFILPQLPAARSRSASMFAKLRSSAPGPPARRGHRALPLNVLSKILILAGPWCEDPSISEVSAEVFSRMLKKQRRHQAAPSALPGKASASTESPEPQPPQEVLQRRSRLVDFLFYTKEMKLKPGTVFLAMSIVDRLLRQLCRQPRNLEGNAFDLIAAVSVHIAGKYEEISGRPPLVSTILEAMHSPCTMQQVLDIEPEVLSRLDFRVAQPTAACILPVFLDVLWTWRSLGTTPSCSLMLVEFAALREPKTEEDVQREETAWTLLKLAIVDWSMATRFLPSEIAASAVILSNRLFGCQPEWPVTLARLSSHSWKSLTPCVDDLERQSKAAMAQQSDRRAGIAEDLRSLTRGYAIHTAARA